MEISKPQRTTTGCWTCRMRRKKCEEGGPPCRTCLDKGIPCHGYGPRPIWKDRGEKEKAELEKVMQQASTRRRRTNSLRPGSENSAAASITIGSPSRLPLQSTPPDEMEVFNDFSMAEDGSTGGTLDFTDVQGLDDWTFNAYGNIPTPGNLHDNLDFEALFAEDLAPLTVQSLSSVSTCSNEVLAAGSLHWACANLEATQEVPAVQPCQSFSDLPGSIDQSADLTVWYIRNTFSLQLPLFTGKEHLGWLLTMLHTSKTFSLTCSSMGAYHRGISDPISHDLTEAYLNKCHRVINDEQAPVSSALQGFGEGSPATQVEEMICCLQLSYTESLVRKSEGHSQYFSKASHNFSMLMKSLFASLRAPHKQAFEVFGALLLFARVLQSTLSRTQMPLQPLPRQTLDLNFFDVEMVTGCSNWALSTIMDVLELEQWKSHGQQQGNLSLVKLVKRGEEIMLTTQRKLILIDDELSKSEVIDEQLRQSKLVTSIFAHAALVYANTVLSGAIPSVPEVGSAVGAAIAVWRLLPKAFPIHILRWPYCVTASLATGQERQFFSGLVASSAAEVRSFGMFDSLQRIVEHCWQHIDTKSASELWDWRDSARALGLRLLFV